MRTKPDSEPASLIVVPSHARHAAGIEQLQAEVYSADPHEWDDMITAEQALTHQQLFPEGQFVAVDRETDQVIGMTVSMRIDFDPAQPFLEPWTTTTDYG
ncbi:MAG: hypothetical protein AAF125_21405 [Chloroflexota bacterium]